jgi:very-short-patch-repair endonuclease
MSNIKPTEEELILNKALNNLGIETKLQHWDGHKHIDIFIPAGKIYIEVDGVNHFTDVRQIMSDFQRDHYSDDDGFHTLWIPSDVVNEQATSIASAILKILKNIDIAS